jgi:succinate dehydrogenase/fumarate reductase flavoprotein subunit
MTHPSNTSEQQDRPTFRVSRRGFLQAAGVGAAGAALTGPVPAGAIPFRDSRAAAQGSWDQETDIVVVGSGAAALTAAVIAHSLGNAVVVLEKADTVGGTTGKSGGVYWIPNNSLMAELGVDDPKDDAIAYMARCAYPQLFDGGDPLYGLSQEAYDLLAAFYDNGPVAVDTLAELGALQSTSWMAWDDQPFPDYYAQFPENKAPRGRGLQPRTPDGTAGAGFEIIRQLQAYAESENLPIQTGHRVVSVVQNAEGAVIGVEVAINTPLDAPTDATPPSATPAAVPATQLTSIRASKAVIFGSGGFTHNPEMRVNYLRGPVFGGCAVPTNEGDFVNIGIDAGAALGNMANAFWAQIPLEQALQFSSTPSDIFSVPGDSLIMVNKYGHRVVNEKIQYNERTQAHFVWDPVAGEFPNLVLIMVYDQRTVDLYGGSYPIPAASVEDPAQLRGDTWEDLVAALDERLAELAAETGGVTLGADFAANLTSTVEQFNAYAQSGEDEAFHRGEAPIELAFHGPPAEGNDSPNPTMYPLADAGPYYAMLIGGGTLDTKGGPQVNPKAQALTPDGQPIAGLYGAGNCIASPSGQAYWAGGGTLGPAITFGYIAGTNASDEPAKSE